MIVYVTQCVADIERYVTDKTVQQLKKTAKSNNDKFSDIRRKLKEKELFIEGDLKDVEQLITLYVTVEERQKVIEEKVTEIKEDSMAPEDIRKNLEIAKVCI